MAGLTSHVTDVTNRFAAEGLVALAPDLFGASTTHDAGEAERLMGQLPAAQAATDLGGAVDHLLGHDAVTGSLVGSVGFCMGGGFVLMLRRSRATRSVPRCRSMVLGEDYPSFANLSAPLLGHFGEQNDLADPETVRALADRIERESGTRPDFRITRPGARTCADEAPIAADFECA